MLKAEIKDILEKPAWVLLIAATLFYLTGLFLFSHFVWSSNIYEYNYTAETGFENYIDMVRRIDFVRYVLSPVYIFSLSGIAMGLIKIGLMVHNIELGNKLLFKIILIATFFLSLPLLVKSVWFVLIQGSYTMNEVKYSYPLSVLYFFDPAELHEKLVKALGRLNLYHLAFMLFIAWCIRIYTNHSLVRLFGIVIYTYGLGFLLLQMIMILIFM
ncbi:hypothetical protein SAMN05444280_12335 [Tangfeifania diversioriginum]|uniref:Yip1 domain-containing protein n=1 Tax=Tangfeifania diversioriginum TaxID=1168035 RepID=A0A1M6KGB3_9BACT|nr:hypothetical protein [Tangfeifania diversioriginum]SHJ57954.1 hypothetical protein SAMN05444280_12335 [Tangfeifania diversioriginum]